MPRMKSDVVVVDVVEVGINVLYPNQAGSRTEP